MNWAPNSATADVLTIDSSLKGLYFYDIIVKVDEVKGKNKRIVMSVSEWVPAYSVRRNLWGHGKTATELCA